MFKKKHSFSEINRKFPDGTAWGKISYLCLSLLVLKKMVFNDTSHRTEYISLLNTKKRGLGMTRTDNPLDDLYILEITCGIGEWWLDSVSH